MNKTKQLLLPIGLLVMGSSYFARYIDNPTHDLADFIKGFGFALILSALFFITKTRPGR